LFTDIITRVCYKVANSIAFVYGSVYVYTAMYKLCSRSLYIRRVHGLYAAVYTVVYTAVYTGRFMAV